MKQPAPNGKIIRLLLLITVIVLFPWSRAGSEDCNEAWNWYEEGRALFDNSPREAFYYQRALELCPQMVEAHNSLGRVYRNQGLYELSIRQYREAGIQALSSDLFASHPGSRDLFLDSIISLGEVYRFQGKYNLAAAEFTRALEIYPDSRAAQNNLQYVYKRLNKYDHALSPHSRLLTNAVFTRIPGMTLPRGGMLVDLQYKNWAQEAPLTLDMFESDEVRLVGAPDSRGVRVQVGIMGLRYGLTNDITLGLIGKYFFRKLELETNVVADRQIAATTKARPRVEGVGDLQFLVKYHLWGQRKTHLAFYNLLTLPIADEKIAETNVRHQVPGGIMVSNIRRRIPMGAESFDFTPGLAFTTYLDPAIFHLNVQYRFTDGKYVGDEFRTDCGIIYPLYKSVNATIEAGYRWRDDTRQEFLQPQSGPIDNRFTEKGGNTVFFSPGFLFEVGRGVKLELGVKIPLVKQKKGWAEDFVFHAGMSIIKF